jgi:hypothetical protein
MSTCGAPQPTCIQPAPVVRVVQVPVVKVVKVVQVVQVEKKVYVPVPVVKVVKVYVPMPPQAAPTPIPMPPGDPLF